MKPLIIALIGLALPASIAFSETAEAKRFRFSSGSSKPAASPAKPAATPAAAPAAQPSATRGSSTLIIVPSIGVGSAQAATRPEATENRKQLDATRQQEDAAAKKDAKRKADESQRASLPAGHEVPRIGAMSASEAKPKLPGFSTLN
ncbi:MAG: hypothetical protein ACRCWO_04940 [Bosea sp. (in: a-proteobacteria)]